MKLIFSLLLVCALFGCTNKKQEPAKAALEAEKAKQEAEAKMQENEVNALGTLRSIRSRQIIFQEKDESHRYGTLEQLVKAKLLSEDLAAGKKQGYLFKTKPTKGQEEYFWTATATPVKPGETGTRHFFVDQTGVIRFSTEGPANEKSTVDKH